MTIKWKKLLLTGATGGIGETVAQALDKEGCQLLLTGRSENKLKAVLASLNGSGHQYVKADLTDQAACAIVADAAREFGAQGVINSLGINDLALLSDISDKQVVSLVNTNLVAPINLCKSLLPFLKEQPEAVVVNIGSILGSIGYAGSAVYCATKFGLRGFSESLRRELGDSSVNVIYLAPRATNTTLNSELMNQMNLELGNATDDPYVVARELISLLQREQSGEKYIGWPESFFVKLNSLFPRLVDSFLIKQLPIIRRYCGAAKQVHSVQNVGGV